MKVALYFTMSYPDSSTFLRFLNLSMNSGYEYVELGIPSKNTYYDGPAIRKTHSIAMNDYEIRILKESVNIAKKNGRKIYLLVYYNYFENNEEEFLSSVKNMEIDGLIVPDILIDYPDEYASIIRRIRNSSLHLIPFFTSATPDTIIKDVSSLCDSWIYCGIQPSTGINMPVSLDKVVERMRLLMPGREIVFGFGIRNMEQISSLREMKVGGVAVGTALIPYLEKRDESGFISYIQEVVGNSH
ncbi:tryptophan synthase subunit alpha [Caldiplasma sukawensis]